jgi:hypothetical protein
MPHVEKLANLLVLPLPIYSLTSPGTIAGGKARITIVELEIWRSHGSTHGAALGHDY